MRTKDEIMEYLCIGGYHKITESVIDTALLIEEKYKEQLEENLYGYGLECDFCSTPFVLEDEEDDLKKIKIINGIVIYEILDGRVNYK